MDLVTPMFNSKGVFMTTLRKRISEEILRIKEVNAQIAEKYGDKEICKVTPKNIFAGMRGIVEVVCNTSYVDANKGLIIKGYPLSELSDKKAEEIFYLLCTGNLPQKDELCCLQRNLALRSSVPREVWNILFALPDNTHPMTMLSIAILVLERESVFRDKYEQGLRKKDFWKSTLEDCLELIAKLPSIAAAIYRIRYEKDDLIRSYDSDLDWSANFANMLGIDTPDEDVFADLIRLYLVLHCDHEGCNASAFTSRVVSSTLSDIYRAVSSGLNALAGPLHGLANQNSLKFVLSIKDKFDGCPSKEQMEKYLRSWLETGKIIPGYGHAVLRKTDPRFTEIKKFANKYLPDNKLIKIVNLMNEIAPMVLKEQGKARSVYPNVDAISGAVLYALGLEHFDYYTVIFGISRILGFCAQLVIARGLNSSIIRPKSVTSEMLEEMASKN